MELLHDSLGFAVKGLIVFLTVTLSVLAVVILTRRRGQASPRLEVKPLNRRFEALGDAVRHAVADKAELKALEKERKKAPSSKGPRVYVLDFDGDIMATAVTNLREEVSALLAVLRPDDEVVVRLESPGGGVPHYGLAAAQLVRLKDKKVKLTICVDRVAASGGYMMACVADRIVAAPFSIVGSERYINAPISELDLIAHAPRLGATKALVVHDVSDAVVPVASAHELVAAWPGARLIETTGLSHDRVRRDTAVVSDVVEFVTGQRLEVAPTAAPVVSFA